MMRTKKLRPVTRLTRLSGVLLLVLGASLALKAGLSGAGMQAECQCNQVPALAGASHQATAETPPVQRLLLTGLVSLLALRSYNRYFRPRAIAQCRSGKRLSLSGKPVPGRGST